MLTTSLTSREDLVESLDSDSIFDYLLQHGVLDEGQRAGIQEKETRVQRNQALLKYVQDTGNSAVGLFINALRQSGQLHLASSLDNSSRIKPMYGSGQVTIRVEVGSILAIYPKWEDEVYPEITEEVEDSSNVVLTPRRAHKSYENMTLIGEPESAKSWRIREYNYDSDDEPSRSCWCFCRPSRKKAKNKSSRERTSKRKLDYEVKEYSADRTSSQDAKLRIKNQSAMNGNSKGGNISSLPPRELAIVKQETPIKKGSVTSLKNGKCDTRVLYSKGEISEARLNSELREIYRNSLSNLNKRLGSNDSLCLKNHVSSVPGSMHSLDGKENFPPDQATPRRCQTPSRKDTKVKHKSANLNDVYSTSEKEQPVETCIMWKSRGPTFDSYVEKFCSMLDVSLNTDIVKYFEQNRGSLVLSVSIESCLLVCTICMTMQQVQQITQDIENGELLNTFESLLLCQDLKDAMCISDIKLKVIAEEEEITLALSELS
ncbi:hypothetical protein FSP39_010239 [Pinctada imbricata]|uniref:CARD domain-containing protein n=1 Tax=Pinctada imbricata TaxID=66713 RepID=A0AA88YSQ7_PINIB|nr:hypothetical protein FSP39_010239 [Pinctada imbricata]